MISDELLLSRVPPEGQDLPSGKLLFVGLAAATRFALPYLRSSAGDDAKALVAAELDRLWGGDAAAGAGEATAPADGTISLEALVVDDDDIVGARNVQFYTNDVADVLAYLAEFAADQSKRQNVDHCFARIHESLDLYAQQQASTGGEALDRLLAGELDRRRRDIEALATAPLDADAVAKLRAEAGREAMDFLLELYD